MGTIREDMPLLARHEGRWKGTYIHVDADGNVTDRHDSLLTCTLPADGEHDYHQVNEYTWADGRTEERVFPGVYQGNGHCTFDTERLRGEFWEVDERIVYLNWIYRAEGEDLRLFELIHLSEDGRKRNRVWQWVRDGVCYQRTLISEVKLG
ncbi:DUF3598 domain-containing protein [Actinomadura sp. KC345]|uniref:DUF3598 family protein n=1 Tax=Actinomadura sp. KC345 TaxID=2530371 RepID=UPI001053EDB2|nr:DUF3598 family protein [Actinomadura sp. KC345]TDC54306.1 DUF3598 domain-containing protein [Actinomadura sp. KC345]